MMNIITTQYMIASFIREFQLCRRWFEAGDVSMWLELTVLLEATKQTCSFADDTIRQLAVCNRIHQRVLSAYRTA